MFSLRILSVRFFVVYTCLCPSVAGVILSDLLN